MTTEVEKAPLFCSQRLTFAILAFFGHFFVYSERINLSVAILCMVREDAKSNTTSLGQDADNATNKTVEETVSTKEMGEFDWSKLMQSQLLATYFYGYVFTQILGGWLSSRYGGKNVWGFCQIASGVLTLLTPISARTDFYLVCVVRVMLGLAAGVAFPSVHALLGRWAPPLERSKLVSYSLAGPSIGMVATLAVSGFLCEYGFDNGWASIFYLGGIFNLIWVAAWFFLTADGPDKHRRISDRERIYIQHAIGKGKANVTIKVPWSKIFQSRAVYGIIVAHMGSTYTTNTLLTSLPMFMKEALEFDIEQNGLLSALPFVMQFLAAILFGFMADKFIELKWLSVKNTRKLFQSTSSLGSAAMFCLAVQMDSSRRNVVVVIMCLAAGLNSANRGGYLSNHLDLAPSYSGVLFGITNTFSNVFGITAPLVAGALTPNKTAGEWANVFYVTSAVCVVAVIVYVLLADGELQEWAIIKDTSVEVVDPKLEGSKENGEAGPDDEAGSRL